jgi:hypothetical protein
VTIQDTVPPVIGEISATPQALWPPNRRMVPVALCVEAQDNCGPATSRIIAVRSAGRSHTRQPDTDWEITGDLTLNLRANPHMIYTVLVESADASGNKTQASVNIPVTHNIKLRPQRVLAPPPESAGRKTVSGK